MSFLSDRKRGEIGERVVASILKVAYPKDEITKSEGKIDWDFTVSFKHKGDKKCVPAHTSYKRYEVKYDEKARDTGNICFEVSNGTKLTGVFASKVDYVFYIVPTKQKDTYEVFKMGRHQIVDWLKNNPKLTKAVNGGDKNKFSLLLVKKDVLLNAISELGESRLGSYMTWVEPQD